MQRFSRNALPLRRRMLRIGLPAALIALAAFFMRRLLGEALTLILGAAAVAFLLEPLIRVYERRLARPRAALAAMGTVLGALAAVGLALIGLRSALVLGVIVGVLNMIPYFGPVLGGIPAVLAALGGGWKKAALTVFVLWAVQQADGMVISPRILGGVTGLSPAAVLIAIFVGSHVCGILGMLLALPVLMTFRTAYRIFVQRHENV